MALVRRAAVIALGVLVVTSSAMADSLSLDKTLKTDSAPINLNAAIPPAKGINTAQSPTDADAAVTDLESSEAAIDRRTGAAITLGVSGWVGEQVIATHR